MINKNISLIKDAPGYCALESGAKKAYIDVVLRLLGPAFEVVTDLVPECADELAYWEDGRRFALGVLPEGPAITLEKRDGKIRYLGTGLQNPKVSLLFKNLDCAMMCFTTYMGTVQAAAENRVLISGDNGMAMEAVRILDLVETYLFPQIILNMNFRRPPRLDISQRITKARVYAGVVPAVIRSLM